MTAITLDIPEETRIRIGIGKKVSYETLIVKTIGKEYISPDLQFTQYSNMSDNHKKEYDKLENIDKTNLLNV